MAADWWLMKNCQIPTLRFYSWEYPTVSLGYRQQFNPPEQISSILSDYHTVIRPTGGGYLFHGNEITYSIMAPESSNLSDHSITEAYNMIEQCFETALKNLGLLPRQTSHGQSNGLSENCLDEAAEHEPVVENQKWMASAQTRHGGRFLQHGSLFWNQNDWPSDNLFKHPYFLASEYEQENSDPRQKVRGEIIRIMNRKLFSEKNLILENLDDAWKKIRKIESLFQLRKKSELPKFQRHSKGALSLLPK